MYNDISTVLVSYNVVSLPSNSCMLCLFIPFFPRLMIISQCPLFPQTSNNFSPVLSANLFHWEIKIIRGQSLCIPPFDSSASMPRNSAFLPGHRANCLCFHPGCPPHLSLGATFSWLLKDIVQIIIPSILYLHFVFFLSTLDHSHWHSSTLAGIIRILKIIPLTPPPRRLLCLPALLHCSLS